MTIEIGSTIEGTVVKVADYGAIVRLAGGKMGLVHVSEVANTFVRDVQEFIKENDRISVKVLKLNSKGRYELSVKQADGTAMSAKVEVNSAAPAVQVSRPALHREFRPETRPQERLPVTFEDKLSQFMKDSQERLLDIKRNVDSKRGARRR